MIPGNCTSGLALQPVGTCAATAKAFQYEAPNSVLVKLRAVRWYIGNNANGGRSLYQSHLKGGTTAEPINEEIIQNVQNMGITYLLRGANSYIPAATVGAGNWVNVVRSHRPHPQQQREHRDQRQSHPAARHPGGQLEESQSMNIRPFPVQSGLQRGATLVVVLILLLIMTVLGLTILRGTSLEERMSANMRDRSLSFQAAEAALREGEGVAATSPPPPGSGCNATGVCATPVATSTDRWLDSGFNSWRSVTTSMGTLATPSSYIVEYMGQAPTWPGCDRKIPVDALCLSPLSGHRTQRGRWPRPSHPANQLHRAVRGIAMYQPRHQPQSLRDRWIERLRTTMFACLATLLSLPANAGIVFPNDPLTTGSRVPPNIMFILDDSGSMAFDYMPDSLPATSTPNVARYAYTRNSISYNPAVDYLPWVNAAGAVLSGGTSYSAVYGDFNKVGGNTIDLGDSGSCRNYNQNDSSDDSSKNTQVCGGVQTFYVPKDTTNTGASYLGNGTNYYRYQILAGGSDVVRSEYGAVTSSDTSPAGFPKTGLNRTSGNLQMSSFVVPANVGGILIETSGGTHGSNGGANNTRQRCGPLCAVQQLQRHQ